VSETLGKPPKTLGTLGEPHSSKKVRAKPTLPSVFYRALGKAFAVETEKNPKKIEIFKKK